MNVLGNKLNIRIKIINNNLLIKIINNKLIMFTVYIIKIVQKIIIINKIINRPNNKINIMLHPYPYVKIELKILNNHYKVVI